MAKRERADLLDGRLKLRHLVILTSIAEHGSIVAAARSLHVTQPVVTRALKEAEAAAGARLFDRGPRGVTPTPFGEIMIDHAMSALSNLRNAGLQMDALRQNRFSPVRIGTNLAGAPELIPRAVIALKEVHPEITVSVLEGMPEALTTQLLRRDLDLVVGRIHADDHVGTFRYMRLYDEPVRIATRRGHPAIGESSIGIAELASFPWVLPSPSGRLRDELDELFTQRGLELPANVIECSTIPLVRSVLLGTDAVAPLPALVVARDEALTAFEMPLETVPRTMGITLLADVPPSRSASMMVDLLLLAARELSEEFHLRGPIKSPRFRGSSAVIVRRPTPARSPRLPQLR